MVTRWSTLRLRSVRDLNECGRSSSRSAPAPGAGSPPLRSKRTGERHDHGRIRSGRRGRGRRGRGRLPVPGAHHQLGEPSPRGQGLGDRAARCARPPGSAAPGHRDAVGCPSRRGDSQVAAEARQALTAREVPGWTLQPVRSSSTPLHVLQPLLATRYYGILSRNGFSTVEEVEATPDIGLLALRGAGAKFLDAVHTRGRTRAPCRRVGADSCHRSSPHRQASPPPATRPSRPRSRPCRSGPSAAAATAPQVPHDIASRITGTSPAVDTRFGSSNTTETAAGACLNCIYEMPLESGG